MYFEEKIVLLPTYVGRADVVIKTKTDIFVLELKVDDSVENADGRKVTKCGVSISSEVRNITQWCIVNSDGKIFSD